MSPNRFPIAVVAGLAALLVQAAGAAGTSAVTIDAQANIYAAGLANTDSFPGGGGVLPLAIALSPGDTAFSLTNVTAGPAVAGSPTGGATCVFDGPASSGDGNTCVSSVTDIDAANGYASFRLDGRTMPVVGLFVGAAKSSIAPLGQDSSFAAVNAQTIAFTPLLQQVFFIGDGLSAGGASQSVLVPAGATMLYLGFADGFGFSGAPGYYGDNFGSVVADLVVVGVPEPSAALLLAAGLGLLAVRRRRPRTQLSTQ
jgi:hypothetical protein